MSNTSLSNLYSARDTARDKRDEALRNGDQAKATKYQKEADRFDEKIKNFKGWD